MDLATVVVGVMSAGGAAFVAAVAQGLRDLRAGARASRGDVITSQRRWITDLEARLSQVEQDRDYWRDQCARRGYALRDLGQKLDTLVPPSERVRTDRVAKRRPAKRPEGE